MYEFKAGKEYKTRDGRLIRILSVHPDQHRKYIGELNYAGQFVPKSWLRDGSYLREGPSHKHGLDLVSPEKYAWLNVYRSENTGELYTHYVYHNKDMADYHSSSYRVGCLKVKLEERFDY